jgi:hypothetical protein
MHQRSAREIKYAEFAADLWAMKGQGAVLDDVARSLLALFAIQIVALRALTLVDGVILVALYILYARR